MSPFVAAIMSAMEHVRIDKWLWAARFFKTRTAATEAVLAGRAQVNGERVKPAKETCAGDTIDVRVGDTHWSVVVQRVAEKRGSATVAATLYEETAESAALRAQRAAEHRMARPLGADLGARPTKRDRRLLDELRRQQRTVPPEGD